MRVNRQHYKNPFRMWFGVVLYCVLTVGYLYAAFVTVNHVIVAHDLGSLAQDDNRWWYVLFVTWLSCFFVDDRIEALANKIVPGDPAIYCPGCNKLIWLEQTHHGECFLHDGPEIRKRWS